MPVTTGCAGHDTVDSTGLTERQRMLFRGVLALISLAVYARIGWNEFIKFDDPMYIVDNPWLRQPWSLESIRYLFSLEKGPGYWHPLTMFSLMLDFKLFGLNPAGYHLENLLIHSMSSLLLLELLFRSTRRFGSAFMVAALFALHPVNVEVVAWAVERKTALCTLIFFLMLFAYGRYVAAPSLSRYLGVFFLFALGLMAKSMLITAPALLLLLDVWPLKRCHPGSGHPVSAVRGIVLEKLPLCLLSLGSLLLSLASFRSFIEVMHNTVAPLTTRVANALISAASYPVKLLWPANLSLFYPLLKSHASWQVILSAGVLVAVTGAAMVRLRRWPWLFAGWFWYLIALVPVSGLLRRGLWPEMADRFVYLPSIGLLVIAVWGLNALFDHLKINRSVVTAGCCAVLAAYAVVTCIQAGAWRTTESIYLHSLKATTDNDMMLFSLGKYYCGRAEYQKGLALLRRAAEINPDNANALKVYEGEFETSRGNYDAAERLLRSVIAVDESNYQAVFFLARNLEESGNAGAALYQYNTIVNAGVRDAQPYLLNATRKVAMLLPTVAPDLAQTRKLVESGVAPDRIGSFALRLDTLGFFEEALQWYRTLEKTMPDNWQLSYNTANVLKKLRRLDEAAGMYRRVIELNPALRDAHNNLGSVYMMQGKYDAAMDEFDQTLMLSPAYGYAAFNRALTLRLKKDLSHAVSAFRDIEQHYPELAEMARYELSVMNVR